MYSSSPPPPGWYDNPVGDGQRFWDGRQWTGQVRIPWPEPEAAPPPSDRTILQPAAAPARADAYPPTVAMPLPLPMERVRRNAPGRGPGVRIWLAIGAAGVLAVVGAAVAAGKSSRGETDAGSAPGSTVAVAPLIAAPDGAQAASGAPSIKSTTTVAATAVTVAATAAPTTAAPTTAAPSTRAATSAAVVAPVTSATAPPTTRAPTTQATSAPTTQAPATSVVETTVPNAVTPGAFCSPEGATGLSAKAVPMICSSTNAQGVPYGEGKSRWRSQ